MVEKLKSADFNRVVIVDSGLEELLYDCHILLFILNENKIVRNENLDNLDVFKIIFFKNE